MYDAVVVGGGPNGLAAAVTLARRGLCVHVLEANTTVGGGARSGALTEAGFVHDLGSAVHPLGMASPFFRALPLERYGLRWIQPDLPLAHPLDDRRAVVLRRSLEATVEGLGADGEAYYRLMAPLVEHWEPLLDGALQPLLHVPQHPFLLARFGLQAVRSARGLADTWFVTPEARALFAGLAAHSILPLEQAASASFGLVLGVLAHAVGWPVPEGGAQAIADALAAYLRDLGGTVETGVHVQHLADVPPARAILLDLTPRGLLRLAGDRLPPGYRRRLERFRYGWGIFKVDYALDGPIPWGADVCKQAGTVHLGGTFDEIAAGEAEVGHGRHPDKPYVLLAQPSLFDATRAPEGKHVVWAYCHVPQGSAVDMSPVIEQQIERFAPGFRDLIRTRHASTSSDLERSNANLIGGTINGGTMDLWQLLARPVLSPAPYRTPLQGVYLCSSSTPPGGGVHGMCGYHAAKTALKDQWRDT